MKKVKYTLKIRQTKKALVKNEKLFDFLVIVI